MAYFICRYQKSLDSKLHFKSKIFIQNFINLKYIAFKLDPCIKLDGKRSKKNQTRKPNRINIEFLDSVKQVRKFQVQCLEDSSVDVTVPYIPNQNDEFTMVTQVIY